jgi:hypothetical protein
MPSFLSGRYGVIFLVLFVCLVLGGQMLFVPYIELAHGLGYDGCWYHQPSLSFLGKVDNYHLFRILPSKLGFLLRYTLGLDEKIDTTVRIFQFLNLLFVILTIGLLNKISSIKGYTPLKKFLFFLLCLFNFSVLKEFSFNPVMTDAMGFFLSTLILWLSLKKHTYWLILALVAALFCLPIIPVFYLIWFLLQSFDSEKIEETKLIIFEKFFRFIPMVIGFSFVLISSIIVLYFKRTSVYTFPDEINLVLFPISLLCNFWAFWFVTSRLKLFFFKGLSLIFKPFKILTNPWFVLLATLLLFQNFASNLNNKFMIGISGIFVAYPINLNLKPFIGIVDNLSFYGPVVFLFLILFIRQSSLKNPPLHQGFLYLIFFLVILKPEARHSLFLIPLISLTVLDSIPSHLITVRFAGITAIIAAIFSKFWYPTHWAHFPPPHLLFSSETNQKIYQEFPVQHYFMFQGLMMAHWPYFLFLLLNLVTGYFFWLELKPGLKNGI